MISRREVAAKQEGCVPALTFFQSELEKIAVDRSIRTVQSLRVNPM
jgi:hypothetical protein